MGMIMQNGKQYFPVYDDTEIKALPTVDTASGEIATFNTDLTENLVEVKCQIVAKQASGTPSPDNPLPITVYNALNLERTNNDNFICGFISNANVDETGKIVSNTSFNMAYALVIKGETYIITAELSGAIVCGYYGDIPQVGSMALDNTRHIYSSNVFTADATGFICFRMTNTFTTPQLEKGNMATAYKDYTNNIGIHIPFGQTVANGVLDITTGKLRATHGYDMLKTSETWNSSPAWSKTNTNAFYSDTQHPEIKFPDLEYQSFSACNYLPVGSRTDLYVGDSNMLALSGGTTRGQLTVRIDKTICPDLTSFIQWITDNQVYYVYELASPLTVQLDSITLQALLNENNIWCDTGDTEVKFLLTVGKKIS